MASYFTNSSECADNCTRLRLNTRLWHIGVALHHGLKGLFSRLWLIALALHHGLRGHFARLWPACSLQGTMPSRASCPDACGLRLRTRSTPEHMRFHAYLCDMKIRILDVRETWFPRLVWNGLERFGKHWKGSESIGKIRDGMEWSGMG